MKNFAIVGASGYMAPLHMNDVADTGNRLVAAFFDPNDFIGVIDGYAPEAAFFTEFERFDRYIDILRRDGDARRGYSLTPKGHCRKCPDYEAFPARKVVEYGALRVEIGQQKAKPPTIGKSRVR